MNSTVSGVGYNVAKALITLGEAVDFLSLIGRDSADDFIAAVRALNAAVGIPEKLDKLQPADYPAIIARATAEADGYPVPYMLTDGDVEDILKELQA